jgi:hypothetical protein
VSFVYCTEDKRGRWFYIEYPDGGGNAFSRDRSRAHHFATKGAAWEHCRKRRRGTHWSGSGPRKWIVITVRDLPAPRNAQEPK